MPRARLSLVRIKGANMKRVDASETRRRRSGGETVANCVSGSDDISDALTDFASVNVA